MATGTTTYNDLPPAVREAYKRKLLERAMEDQVYMLFADEATIDQNSGDRILYRRYDPYPVATTPMTDGIVSSPRKPTYTEPTAELNFYGDYTKLTKRAIRTNLEQVTQEIIDIHGQQAGETIDSLMRDVLYSGASYVNASNGVNGGTPTEATFADVETVVKLLRNNAAKKIAPAIEGSTKVGTSPVSKSYFAFFHTDIRDDIRAMDRFVPAHQYSQMKPVYEMEFGAVDDVRFIETNNGYVSSGTYSIPIMGLNAYTAVSLSGNNVNVYRMGFGSAGTEDPFAEFTTIGWDAAWTGLITNDNWIIDLRVTHS